MRNKGLIGIIGFFLLALSIIIVILWVLFTPKPPPQSWCGDGDCINENCETCEQDCGVCPPVSECGNNVCDAEETCNTCEQDCGQCVEPPGTLVEANDFCCSTDMKYCYDDVVVGNDCTSDKILLYKWFSDNGIELTGSSKDTVSASDLCFIINLFRYTEDNTVDFCRRPVEIIFSKFAPSEYFTSTDGDIFKDWLKFFTAVDIRYTSTSQMAYVVDTIVENGELKIIEITDDQGESFSECKSQDCFCDRNPFKGHTWDGIVEPEVDFHSMFYCYVLDPINLRNKIESLPSGYSSILGQKYIFIKERIFNNKEFFENLLA